MCQNHSRYIRYFNENSALKSALLPHANTQSPDDTGCNWSLMVAIWTFLWTSITYRYPIYISPVGECATMLHHSKNCSSFYGITASLKTDRRAHKFWDILKNQSIWAIKIILLYRRVKDSFKGHFLC